MRKKITDQFLSSNLFYGFNRKIFLTKLIDLFANRKVFRNEIILKEGDNASSLFLIIKGEFDIFTRRSLIDLDNIITRENRSRCKFKETQEQEKIDSKNSFR